MNVVSNMNCFIFIFLFIACSQATSSEISKEEKKLDLVATYDGKKTNSYESAVDVSERAPQYLSRLHDLAKNISYSKGIYREMNKEVTDDSEPEFRRSIIAKATIASESDLVRDILLRLSQGEEDNLLLLENLEYLVHQYDVAVNFAASGGIEIIKPLLLSEDDKIVSSVALVLGSAMQSNPKVQQLALKQDIGTNLLKLSTRKSSIVLPRIIFALGSLLRNYPEAQKKFLIGSGMSKFADLLQDHQIHANTKFKIINLLNDMAIEQQTAEFSSSEKDLEERMKLERLFAHEVHKCNVCPVISSFLYLEDFDSHERIITAMKSLCHVCYKDFKDITVSNRLHKLGKNYDPESNNNDPFYPVIDKDLKLSLYSELNILIEKINEEYSKSATKSTIKEEL